MRTAAHFEHNIFMVELVSLRLPSYRGSYVRRYHPYPMSSRHQKHNNYIMDSTPVTSADGWVRDLPSAASLGILRSRDNGSNADVSTLNLDHHSIAPGEHACERDEKRQKLSVMVMSIMLALRRRYQAVLGVKDWLLTPKMNLMK
ncbi:hypothetical protein AcW2_005383 [Taiwanofungus camphoratus]|nr:hypothetical protein AcW2_005383 [Antrodia cinnamomea]